MTAIFVGVIADRSTRESAVGGTAGIVATRVSTVAIFAFLDDAVAALLAGNGLDGAIVGQTLSVDNVATDSTAYIADGAWGEVVDTVGGERVHDELRLGIASVLPVRTALPRGDELLILTGLAVTVVDGSESVAGFVSVLLSVYCERETFG